MIVVYRYDVHVSYSSLVYFPQFVWRSPTKSRSVQFKKTVGELRTMLPLKYRLLHKQLWLLDTRLYQVISDYVWTFSFEVVFFYRFNFGMRKVLNCHTETQQETDQCACFIYTNVINTIPRPAPSNLKVSSLIDVHRSLVYK